MAGVAVAQRRDAHDGRVERDDAAGVLIQAGQRDHEAVDVDDTAALALVEGLSSHVAEWISTGRLDLGLVHNPESQPGLEIRPLLEEPLCLVQRPADADADQQ